MTTIVAALLIVALVLAAIEEFRASGRALLPWAVIALAGALLLERIV